MPTPVNSPPYRAQALSSFSTPDHRRFVQPGSDDDDAYLRPEMRPYHSDIGCSTRQIPGWFGGTGSTMVNTKLKDHVFSTILRRFHKRASERSVSSSSAGPDDVDGDGGANENYDPISLEDYDN